MNEEELAELYFSWLQQDAFGSKADRQRYEGVLHVLHDIPFYWTNWADEDRAGDALSYRQYEFLTAQDLEHLDQMWLEAWGRASPSVLEVLLGMARRWTDYFEEPSYIYFEIMFLNLGFEKFPGRVISPRRQRHIRATIDDWLSHLDADDDAKTPFGPIGPMKGFTIWEQMNFYANNHLC